MSRAWEIAVAKAFAKRICEIVWDEDNDNDDIALMVTEEVISTYGGKDENIGGDDV